MNEPALKILCALLGGQLGVALAARQGLNGIDMDCERLIRQSFDIADAFTREDLTRQRKEREALDIELRERSYAGDAK